MTVRVYRSTNVGAPVLTNTAGTLIPVFDVLVAGLPARAVDAVQRVGSVVTVTTVAPHQLTTGQFVTVSGAGQPEYNGEFAVTVTGTLGFTYIIVGTPATPATGSITISVTGSGWTKPFTSAGVAVFQSPPAANQYVVRVDDTGTTSARIRLFETASDTSGGTNPTPSDAQVTGGLFVFKNAATCPWVMVCNGGTVYLWVNTGNVVGAATTGQMSMFGPFTSYKPGDTYNIMINAATTAALAQTVAAVTITVGAAATGAYALRSYTQIGTSSLLSKSIDSVKTAAALIMGSAGLTYPSPVDGGLYVSPVFLGDSTVAAVRGVMDGIWAPCHNRPLAHGDTFTGTGALSGRVFEAFHNNTTGQILIETSNTW